jgi:pyrimidine operon attenuation protein / uracil phosphoribosyltransferase
MINKRYILDAVVADKKLRRMALEIAENNYNEAQLILIGIKEHGLSIAHKISEYLGAHFKGEVIVLEMHIDKKDPVVVALNSNMDFTGKTIIVMDDVANSGRVMLYALKPLLEQYPKKIQTLALVERTHKNFPVDIDYVGMSVSTTLDEHIYVEVENDTVSGAWIDD